MRMGRFYGEGKVTETQTLPCLTIDLNSFLKAVPDLSSTFTMTYLRQQIIYKNKALTSLMSVCRLAGLGSILGESGRLLLASV